MHYPSSENKGADQLRSYCEADLRLCFRIGNNPVFSRCGSFKLIFQHLQSQKKDTLTTQSSKAADESGGHSTSDLSESEILGKPSIFKSTV